jgi:hypothetical protein
MKTAPQMQKLLVLTAGAALAITALTGYSGDKPKGPKGPKGGNHGTDIIHLCVQVQMDNGGIVTNASGSARINWNQQGNANHQSLQVNVRGLDADTSYELDALLNDDTNLTTGVSFTTDAEGNASINLEDKGQNDNGHGHGHGHAYGHNKPGHTKDTLPAALEPVGHISELMVLDSTGTNVVLSADFTSATSFQYLVKRNISSDTVNAELRIIANPGKAQIRVSASGLAAGDYTLLLNDTAAAMQTADDHGRVDIRAELANPADILSVSSVSLIDAGTNVVVSTTLP